jgi:putative thiamine transport system substrate-binding protein
MKNFLRAYSVAVAMTIFAWTDARADVWADVVAEARGQEVAFNAWAGAPAINAYIAWVAAEVDRRFAIDLTHVKITDAADAVARIVAEKAAGRTADGSVDLLWVNGENFHALKRQDLLYGPFAFDLPNFDLVDTEAKPTTLVDFTVPTEGYESPWGMAQLVVLHDTRAVPAPPATLTELGAWIAANPGRFTYPAPPDFIGTTFLKQVLIDTVDDPAVLAEPVAAADPAAVTAPLWAWLDAATPDLWRGGRAYPADGQALHQLLDDGEIFYSLSFNPGEASQLIDAGRLPATVRTFTFETGTLANTHFVAIPFNSGATAAARVVANFLLSPEAQARKQNPEIWGDPTVLDVDALPAEDRALFDDLPRGVATLPPAAMGPARAEPHPSWVDWLEREWQRRYGS